MSKSGNSSRVPLKKVIQSLKDRTVRKYFKKPSLIHLFYVALLQIINSGKQDSFREKIGLGQQKRQKLYVIHLNEIFYFLVMLNRVLALQQQKLHHL